MTYDLGASYRAARERLSALVAAHGPALDRTVPATPDWTVHDVLAHVAGVAHDAATGNMAGAPGDEWTAAQVARGRGQSADALVPLWAQHAPTLEALLSGPNGAMASAAVMDIHCHEADVRHALGLAAELPTEFLAWAGAAMRDRLAQQVAEADLPPVSVQASDFEWFRGRLGRRTAQEVSAYSWSADPAAYLDLFFIFGRATRPLGEAQQA
ncbi:MAG: maleylpyruvate isomerase family mycothiol-dependent enzyme [Pseudomonas sp.]|uniref:maleylpyruvate isomerase family mycothiol-dependent enzyme n=1 Tax=Pseudomonas sp. TaxID=306 RepID=UPI0027284C83|nr:maleylpyruvate isomerase family mycothiol-dependent enzyme [Pseudomonas sp.]MDO8403154.1 maleylpyruvate isomerase family mycothiol-dependent enzyme [Pseudomonas sp.]